MAIVVENGADQVEAYTTGKGVFPIPPEVKADNEAREAKSDSKPTVKNDKPLVEAAKEPETQKAEAGAEDDTEGEDGLTPRQKRESPKSPHRKTINLPTALTMRAIKRIGKRSQIIAWS